MITGASGFIGSNFIKRYENEYNILSINLLKTSPEELNFKGVDCILHLAALVHQMEGVPREKYFEINTELTKKMAEMAKKNGVGHFVFYSSVKVYGYDGDLYNHTVILDEDSPCNPKNDAYGESKWEAEKLLKNLEDENFIVSIIRPPLVYGEGVKGNMESLVKLIRALPILPFNYDKNRRSMVYIENLLHLTSLTIDSSLSGIFLPIDEKNLSLKEIFEGIKSGLGKHRINIKLPTIFLKLFFKLKPKIFIRLYGSLQFDNVKTRKKLKYSAKVSYEEGIRNTIDEL